MHECQLWHIRKGIPIVIYILILAWYLQIGGFFVDDAIIYGCGEQGKKTYRSYRDLFNIINFADGNEKLHDTQLFGINIISPNDLVKKIACGNITLIIASMYYKDILSDLDKAGADLGFGKVYFTSGKTMLLNKYNHINDLTYGDYEFKKYKCLSEKQKIKKVLFVQDSECARTSKISSCVRKKGIHVSLAYMNDPSGSYSSAHDRYDTVYRILDFDEFIKMVSLSDYDIVHSSNAPDYLTVLLLNSNKPVVHDCHDMMSVCYDIDSSQHVEEYISQKFCAGNLYTTEIFEKFAVRKYNLSGKPTISIPNSITKSLKPKREYDKLSNKTGALHCVYAGTIQTDNDMERARCFDDIFIKIAGQKIHIHIYPQKMGAIGIEYLSRLERLSPYIHNEGNFEYNALMEQLTQYDVGLCYFNVTVASEFVISLASANKMYEYVHAGLPIAVNDIPGHRDFIDKYKCGMTLDLGGDIAKQISAIKSIRISHTLLEDNGLLMEQQIEKLLCFYQDSIEYFNNLNGKITKHESYNPQKN